MGTSIKSLFQIGRHRFEAAASGYCTAIRRHRAISVPPRLTEGSFTAFHISAQNRIGRAGSYAVDKRPRLRVSKIITQPTDFALIWQIVEKIEAGDVMPIIGIG